MNILHLNSNYHRSTIYKNMKLAFVNNLSDHGKVYFPILLSSNVAKNNNEDFLDVRRIIKKKDLVFLNTRSKKILKDISQFYDLNNFDFVLAYSLFSNGNVAYMLNKKFKLPYYVIVQNTDVNFHFKKIPFAKKRGNIILENAKKVIFISESYKENVIEQYVEKKDLIYNKSVVIPFGIDDFWKKNINKIPKKINKNNINLLYVGKITKNKNILTVCKVAERLLKDGVKLKLTVVGTPINKKIYKKIKSYEFVNFIPFIKDKNELLSIYRSNDIFIMPSFYESFGLVYAEAMSQGLPVIYTKGQGFDKQFSDGVVGYSVNPKNIEDIKEKIADIINNYETISNNCLNYVNKFFWENISSYYKNLFEE